MAAPTPDTDPTQLRQAIGEAAVLLDRCQLAAASERLAQVLATLAAQPGGGDPALLALAHMESARVAIDERRFEDAALHCAQSLVGARQAGDADLESQVELVEVSLDLAIGATDKAWSLLETVRTRMRGQAVSDLLEYEWQRALSYCQVVMANQEEALAAAQASLQAAQRSGQPRAVAAALGNWAGRHFALGYRLLSEGQAEAGREVLLRCLSLSAEAIDAATAAGAPRLNLSNLNNLAGAATSLEDDALALDTFARLYALADATGLHTTRVHAMINHARLLRRRGQADEALALIEQAVALGEPLRTLAALSALHLEASRMHEEGQRWQAALVSYKRYHALRDQQADEQAEHVARVVSVRLATEQARQEAQQLRATQATLVREARVDALTGLANRRQFDEDLLRALAVQGVALPGCLALVDVDHFKRVNDSHSHAVGDDVLRQLARLLEAGCRGTDLAARWGGEEFAMLLLGTEVHTAAAVCERVRLAVQQHDWSAIAPGLHVTVSIGLAAITPALRAEECIARADAELYRAKTEGRNRICVRHASDGPQGA